jgi:acyl-CoA thioesterase-1
VSVTRILAFGDSLTEGRIALTANFLAVVPGSYPERLRAQLGARYTEQLFTVPNEGVGGEWAQDGAQRFPGVVRTHSPEVVILLEGANDMGALGRNGIAGATRALETMAKEARFRGARVILAGLPPLRPPSPISPLVSEFNTRVRELARGEGAIYVDLFAAFAGNEAALIGPDGLHPTPAGYQRMADTFVETIRTNFELPSQTTRYSLEESHPRMTGIARIALMDRNDLERPWLRPELF